jgi:hypothetical protein
MPSPPSNRTAATLAVAALAVILASCQEGKIIKAAGQDDGGGGGQPPGEDPGTGGTGAPPPGFGPLPDGGRGGSTGSDPFMDTPKCAEDIRMAERLPLDLVLLVDRSSSMAGAKWMMATQALKSFVSDPRSAGLSVGLQFFPVSELNHACSNDLDCGFAGGGNDLYCHNSSVCVGSPLMTFRPQWCGALGDQACPGGARCVPLGQCVLSNTFCTALGMPCPGGPATDLCTPLGKTCRTADFSESCNSRQYSRLHVGIGPLPLAQPALARSIDATSPSGGTPMLQAVEGTLSFLRPYLTANSTRRVVLVIATDGVPSVCGGGGDMMGVQNAIANLLQAARMATPSLTTYAIGVFSPDEGPAGPMSVNRFAQAGGTGTAFVLSPTNDLAEKLLGALSDIRGAALPCEFTIPPPEPGKMLDFGKVNVHFKGSTGEEDVPYVGSADKCDPTRGGWYYDVDPAVADPTRVVVCEKTCNRFKADASGKVQIGFGCKTRVIL